MPSMLFPPLESSYRAKNTSSREITQPFSRPKVSKHLLYDFTGTVFVQCENPVFSPVRSQEPMDPGRVDCSQNSARPPDGTLESLTHNRCDGCRPRNTRLLIQINITRICADNVSFKSELEVLPNNSNSTVCGQTEAVKKSFPTGIVFVPDVPSHFGRCAINHSAEIMTFSPLVSLAPSVHILLHLHLTSSSNSTLLC